MTRGARSAVCRSIVSSGRCCAGALALLAAALGAQAQTVEPVDPAAIEETLALPKAGQGALRSRIQLVWNGDAGTLERRRYELFDPLAADGLDFFWDPRFPARDGAGALNGEGVLTWREPGSLRYGRETIVAQYRGAMREGRMEGNGVFVHRSRLRYDGEWAHGTMEGEGRLLLPGGDVYAGGFKAGRPHGQGLYLAASGAVYEGGHADGLRHGAGLASEANRFAYAGVWVAGEEDLSRRGPAPEGWPEPILAQARAAEQSDIAASVSLGGEASFCCNDDDTSTIFYTSTPFPDRLEVFPDVPNLLEIWRGERNVVVPPPSGYDWGTLAGIEYGFRDYTDEDIRPVEFLLGLENRSGETAQIVGAFLEIDRSVVETRPALQAISLQPVDGNEDEFSIENYGWSTAEAMTLRYRFTNAQKGLATEPQEIAIGDVADIRTFSFADAMKELGGRADELARLGDHCVFRDCFDEILATGVFGGLTDYMQAGFRTYGVDVEGTISYRWRDHDGEEQTGEAPFEVFLPAGVFQSESECGEGGSFIPIAGLKPFSFREEPASYRIPLPVSGIVPAGAVGRWRLTVEAPKSSSHDFRIVFQLADGRMIRSRDVDLLFFRPRNFPDLERPVLIQC